LIENRPQLVIEQLQMSLIVKQITIDHFVVVVVVVAADVVAVDQVK